MSYKPILFNTPMVQAILDGRKTCTRRVIKPRHRDAAGFFVVTNKHNGSVQGVIDYDDNERTYDDYNNPPYQTGDILWVRETWRIHDLNEPAFCMMVDYKADNHTELQIEFKPSRFDKFKKFFKKLGWISSLFMPREAARIFLRVADVRVERLQDISAEDCISEGIALDWSEELPKPSYASLAYCETRVKPAYKDAYRNLWNSTIPNKDLDRYGWDANPFCWVISFERCKMPKDWNWCGKGASDVNCSQ